MVYLYKTSKITQINDSYFYALQVEAHDLDSDVYSIVRIYVPVDDQSTAFIKSLSCNYDLTNNITTKIRNDGHVTLKLSNYKTKK